MKRNVFIKVVSMSILAIFALVTLFTCVIGFGAVVGGVASAAENEQSIDDYFEYTPKPLSDSFNQFSSIWYNKNISYSEDSRMLSDVEMLMRRVPAVGASELSSITLAIFDCDLINRGDYGYTYPYSNSPVICALNCRFSAVDSRLMLSLSYYLLEQNAFSFSSYIFDTRIVEQYDVQTDLRSVYGVPMGAIDYSSVALSERDGWYEFLVPCTYGGSVLSFAILNSIKTLDDSKYDNAYIVADKLYNTEPAYDGIRNEILAKLSEGITFGFDSKYIGDEKYKELLEEYHKLQGEYQGLQLEYNKLKDKYDSLLQIPDFLQIGNLYTYLYKDSTYRSRLISSSFNYGGVDYLGYELVCTDTSSEFVFGLGSVIPANTKMKISWDLLCLTDKTISTYVIEVRAIVDNVDTRFTPVFVIDSNSILNGIFEFTLDYDCLGFLFKFQKEISPGLAPFHGKNIFFKNVNFYADSDDYYLILSQTYDTGYVNGEINGYKDGYRVGHNKGYEEGSIAQGNYTFFGLISAVVDAPLSVFKTMFDFEVLGVNLSSFMLSLFSISVILCVVKLLIGR